MTTDTMPNQNEFKKSSFFVVAGRALILGSLLAFACLTIWLQLATWAEKPNRSLVEIGVEPSQIETQLKALSKSEREALVTREQHALKANPLNVQALKNLIILFEVAGEKEKSEELILAAANRSLREFPLQVAAINIELAKQQYGSVLYRMDGLIRGKPEFKKEFFTSMMGFAAIPEARAELVKKLGENPPWREQFTSLFASQTSQPDLVYGVYSALRKAGQTVTSIELRQLLQRLVKDQAFEKASFIWLDFLSDVELRKAGLLYDGGFDLEFGNRFFDWTVAKVKNADLRIVPRATGSTDRVLRLEFAAGRTAYNHFSQILRLPAGDYVFSGEQKADQLESSVGMVWQISCLAQKETVITATPTLKDTIAWGAFTHAFSIPATDCPAQRLVLRLNAKAALDQQVSGRVFYDGLSISRAIVEPAN